MNATENISTTFSRPSRISYGVEEASEETGIGRTNIYKAIKLGELASLKIGKRRIVMRDDLLTWLLTKRKAAA